MADWTTIPDSSIEPSKPIRSIDGLALRDNPVAIAEGAVGAPRIAAAALQTGTNERDWVLARTSAADAGAVGTYAWLAQSSSTTTNLTAGTTYAGSGLRYFGYQGASGTNSINTPNVGVAPSGTWLAMGTSSNAVAAVKHTLFLRIA